MRNEQHLLRTRTRIPSKPCVCAFEKFNGLRGCDDGYEISSLHNTLVIVMGLMVKDNATTVNATHAMGRGGGLDSMPTSMYLQMMAAVMVQMKLRT